MDFNARRTSAMKHRSSFVHTSDEPLHDSGCYEKKTSLSSSKQISLTVDLFHENHEEIKEQGEDVEQALLNKKEIPIDEEQKITTTNS
jgi:hypothetical protein